MSVSPNDLSEREIEILRLVATGVGNKEIAQRLNISVNTVKVHLRNIFTKIGVTTRTEAAMYAVTVKLIEAQRAAVEPSTEVIDDLPVVGEDLPAKARPQPEKKAPVWKYLTGLMLAVVVVMSVIWIARLSLARPVSTPTTTPLTMQQGSLEPIWNDLATLSAPRSDLAVVVYENEVYAIAGKTPEGVTGSVDVYSPGENRWRSMAEKPVPVSDVQAAVLSGKIFVPGGETVVGTPSDILEIYSPRDNSWSRGESLPRPLSRYALTAFEGKLYVFGGWDGQEIQDGVYAYDPDEDAWEEKSRLTAPRVFSVATVAGGKIYLIGGFDGKNALRLNEMYLADQDVPNARPWSPRAGLPAARYQMGAVNLADMIYVVGGRGEGDATIRVFSYSPTTDEWQQIETPPWKHWYGIGLAGLGARLYAVGGEIDGRISAQVRSYQAIYLLMFPLLP